MKKVLIADDNEQNREIVKDVLSAWGYICYTAVDGFEVLDLASRNNPDVIVLDVMMPGMNGFEVCRKLKNNITTHNIPVIMLTVLNEIEDRIRGFNVGADVFLSKPIVYEELKNRVEWAVNSKKIYDSMENEKQIVQSFLKILKLKDNNLYVHACNVKNYCEKIGKLLSVTDEEMDHLIIGAYLHDIGKIISNEGHEHIEAGLDIISSLTMSKWLKTFIRNHHEKINGKGYPDCLNGDQMTLELKILILVNRFIELLEQYGDKEISIVKLSDECKMGYWSPEILENLKQVLKDESFIKRMNCNKSM